MDCKKENASICCKEKPSAFERRTKVIEIVISVISIVFVLFTLFEMKAERDAAYRPEIVIEDPFIALSWDDNGLPVENEDAERMLSYYVDESKASVNHFPQISIYNIGVGTARDVTIKWDKTNLDSFIAFFQNNSAVNVKIDGGLLVIDKNGHTKGTGLPTTEKIEYLLNSSSDYSSIYIPFVYYELLSEALLNSPDAPLLIPQIGLTINYMDIQGQKYEKEISLSYDVLFSLRSPDGSGYCIGKLISNKENQSAKQIGVLGLNISYIAGLLPIIAIVISIVALVLVIVFVSKNRRQHSKATAIELKNTGEQPKATATREIEAININQGECCPNPGMSDLDNDDSEEVVDTP